MPTFTGYASPSYPDSDRDIEDPDGNTLVNYDDAVLISALIGSVWSGTVDEMAGMVIPVILILTAAAVIPASTGVGIGIVAKRAVSGD